MILKVRIIKIHLIKSSNEIWHEVNILEHTRLSIHVKSIVTYIIEFHKE